MPLIAGLVVAGGLFAAGVHHWVALLYFFSSSFVLATVYSEYTKGTQARRLMMNEGSPRALYQLVRRNKRRYGGYIIHAGVALMFIGIAASSFYKLEQDVTLAPGKSFALRAYTMTFLGLTSQDDPNKQVVQAKLEISKNGTSKGTMTPERHFYKKSQQPTNEVALRQFWNEDLYIILAGWDEQGRAMFKVFVNPFISLLWIGTLLMAFGGMVVLIPDYRPAVASVRVARSSVAAQES